MYPIVPSYYFKKMRLKQKKTLKEVASDTHIELTYVNKLENGVINPNPRIINRLMKYYNISSDEYEYCSFTIAQIKTWLSKLYYSTFTDKDIQEIIALIKKYPNSGYNYYLQLIWWCRKSGHSEFDKDFMQELTLLKSGEKQLPDQLRLSFLIYQLNYYTRRGQRQKAEQIIIELKNINDHQWSGIKEYYQIYFDLLYSSFKEIPNLIFACRQKLQQTNNTKRLLVLKSLEATYYNQTKLYNEAIVLYKQLTEEYLAIDDYGNYAITHGNIAWIYNLQGKFEKAIPHYLEAIQYKKSNIFYFDLAWCYYRVQDIDACLKVIKEAKGVYETSEYHTLLLKWLEAMVTNPYSPKALKFLQQIEQQHYQGMSAQMKTFLNIALANHYTSMKDFESAIAYYKKIIQQEVSTNISCL